MPSPPPTPATKALPDGQLMELALLWDMARATALVLALRRDNNDPTIKAITGQPNNDQINRAETAAWRYVQKRTQHDITPETADAIIQKWEVSCGPYEIIYPTEIRDEIMQSFLDDVDNRRSTVAPVPPPTPSPTPSPAVIIIDPQLPPQPALWLQPRLQF